MLNLCFNVMSKEGISIYNSLFGSTLAGSKSIIVLTNLIGSALAPRLLPDKSRILRSSSMSHHLGSLNRQCSRRTRWPPATVVGRRQVGPPRSPLTAWFVVPCDAVAWEVCSGTRIGSCQIQTRSRRSKRAGECRWRRESSAGCRAIGGTPSC